MERIMLNDMPGIVGFEVSSILLGSVEVVGLQFHQYARLANNLEVGTQLDLVADPKNAYDGKAVEVLFMGDRVGFLPKETNQLFSSLLRDDIPLEAYILCHDTNRSVLKGDRRLIVQIYMPYTFLLVE